MGSAIINVLINFIYDLGSTYTAPLNDVISSAVPNVNDFLNTISSVLGYVVSGLAWFVNLIPTTTRALILFILNFWVLTYPIRIAVWNISFGLDFIKRINIFGGK